MSAKTRFSQPFELDRSKISTDPGRFQGRQTAFSEDSVKAIIAQRYDRSASPIVVWKDPKNGNYYVLSGHSRFEASDRLYKAGDKTLQSLPVKEFLGNETEAADYAILESNRKGTQESLLSDINAYKRAIAKGYSKQYLLTIFKPESKLQKLADLSHLNQDGKFITNLNSAAAKSFPYLERNAQWVGVLRSRLPQLTDAHESEMFNYLYGSKKGINVTKDQFYNLIDKKVNRIDFVATDALNLENVASTSALTNPINDQIKEIDETIAKLVKDRQKSEELIIRAKTEGKTEMVPQFEARVSDISKIILRKMEEKNYLQHQAGKIERETIFDLFSQPENLKQTEPDRNEVPLIEPVKKDGFTDGPQLNKLHAQLISKYGDKTGGKYYTVGTRLVNPNENNITEIRSNGVVVNEAGKYLLYPFTNTDFNDKKWALGKAIDVTDQYNAAPEPLTCPPIDANGVPRIDNQGLTQLKQCIEKEPSTKAIHTDQAGNYSKERLKLHKKIIDEIKDDTPCVRKGKPIAVLTGGPPGSGKTTFLKKYAPWITSKNVYHIDADEVRAKLPEYKGWNADNTHQETSDIVNKLLDEIGKPCEHDLVYDGTMNSARKYMPLIDKLKGMGYEVFVIYISVPKEVSVERAMGRYQHSGRYVPIEVIDEVYSRGLAGFEEVIKKVDGFIRVDGLTQKIIEKGGIELPKDRNYTFGDAECTDCDHKEAEFEPPVTIDISWIPQPKRGTKYSIAERDELASTMWRFHFVNDNPNKQFIQLRKDVEAVTAKLKKYFGDRYDIIFRNGHRGVYGPNEYIFGYQGWVQDLYNDFRSEYRQGGDYNFALRSKKETWTYDNFLDFYITHAKRIFERCYKYLNELVTLSTEGLPKDAQEFINKYRTFEYPLGSREFLENTIADFYKIDLNVVVSPDRIKPILPKYGITYLSSYQYLEGYVLDGKITIAQYKEIVDYDKQQSTKEGQENSRLSYDYLKNIWGAIYLAFYVDGKNFNVSNYMKLIETFKATSDISYPRAKNHRDDYTVRLYGKGEGFNASAIIDISESQIDALINNDVYLYKQLFLKLGSALYFYRNNPEKFDAHAYYFGSKPKWYYEDLAPEVVYTTLFKNTPAATEPGLITRKDNTLSANQKVKKILRSEFPGYVWKVNAGLWSNKIECEGTLPDEFVRWYNFFLPSGWEDSKLKTGQQSPVELRSATRENIIAFYTKNATFQRPKDTRKREQIKAEYEAIVAEKKAEIWPEMNERAILEIAHQINGKRSLYSQFVDNGSDNKKRLTPTVENLIRWMQHPGQFDLIGVDTFRKTDPTSDYKKAHQKEKLFNLMGIKTNS